MTRNQLPDGVGKKIVEALKRQAEADITPITKKEDNISNDISNNIPLTEIQDLKEVPYEQPINEEASDNVIVEEETFNLPSGIYQEKPEESDSTKNIDQNNNIINRQEQYLYQENIKNQTLYGTSQINIPANVATLKNLIATLPAGVTKQTGAQIIRQTLEAMGLPMTNVLKEAQGLQDELKSSTRECMLKIQDYKTQILQLENSVQEYQKNISQINDLISLFLLTNTK